MKSYLFLLALVMMFAGLTLAGPLPLQAAPNATFTVNSTADVADKKPGNGKCETQRGNGVCTLRAAIQESNALGGKNTIVLAAATYLLSKQGTGEDDAVSGDLDIKSNLTLKGKGASKTIIDGLGYDRIFHIHSGNVKIKALMLKNGTADFGGGIWVGRDAKLVLQKSTVANNDATQDGAGMYVEPSSNAKVVKSTFDHNLADRHGGGILLEQNAKLNVNQSTFSENQAAINGGGIYTTFSDAVIQRSTFASNVAGEGGGVSAYRHTIQIVNSTFSNNRAVYGGGLKFAEITATLMNLTIVENESEIGGAGGGVYTYRTTPDWRNTMIAGNINLSQSIADDCSGALSSSGYNLLGDPTGCTLSGATNKDKTNLDLGTDIQLGPLQNNGGATETRALLNTSLGIDDGNPSGCQDAAGATITIDQRGSIRPTNGDGKGGARCDIGAYEK